MKTCTSCKQDKAIKKFNKKSSAKDGLQSTCRSCNKKHARRYYKNNKQKHLHAIYAHKKKRLEVNKKKLLAFFAKNPCVDCGFDNELALEFDHVRGKKRAEISTLLKNGCSWKIIKEEIEKCEVRCRNCHSIKTHKEQNSYRIRLQ